MAALIDDFCGERPDAEDLSVEELRRIYAETLEVIADPRDLVPKWLWRDQLDTITEELEFRGEEVPS